MIAELEATFDAPVIEAYGMTEAAHQMASNPLARRAQARLGRPRRRARGRDHGRGEESLGCRTPTGEIVIRGANVTAGYENNPKANAEAFTNGWFRTGDQGVMDADGYVRLTGPAEGDHQPRRREDFAARGRRGADGPSRRSRRSSPSPCRMTSSARMSPPPWCCARAAAATEKELRDFASERLAAFKVPRKILFLDEIPKGATGKLQRIGLAEKLGLAG